MERDKLSNFLYSFVLVNIFCFFLAHKVSTNHKASTEAEASAVAREQIHKTFGVGNNSFQDTRHTQEGTSCLVSSHLRVPPLLSSVNAPVTGSMAWAAQLHAVIQQHAWAAAVQTPGGAAGQFAAHQDLLVALRAQQAGAAGGGAAVASPAAAGSSANEASSKSCNVTDLERINLLQ